MAVLLADGPAFLGALVVIGAGLTRGSCDAAAGGATPPPTAAAPPAQALDNQPITVALTCGEFLAVNKANHTWGGTAILWLDGVYAARTGITAFPAGWARTLAQGVGGNCAINVNEFRPVLDIIAIVHQQYGGPEPAR